MALPEASYQRSIRLQHLGLGAVFVTGSAWPQGLNDLLALKDQHSLPETDGIIDVITNLEFGAPVLFDEAQRHHGITVVGSIQFRAATSG